MTSVKNKIIISEKKNMTMKVDMPLNKETNLFNINHLLHSVK